MTGAHPGEARPDLTTAAGQFDYLTEGSVDVVRPDELKTRIERSLQQGEPLVVKTGFDPSSADIHLGHVVLIRKMKQFQDCGHQVVFVVGDFTAMIGDPTGRSKTRPQLSREQILANAETYRRQALKVLDDSKTKFMYNSEWLDTLGSSGLIRLAAKYNVARMLERRDFRQRYEAGQSIAVHEFLYPLAQAYDSVALRADVELGGTDQLFNLNVGRDIMPEYGLPPQIVMTTPLLEGLDGVEKMSKSLGNYIAIEDTPSEMFGKLMSISDDLMWKYWMLVGGAPAVSVILVSAEIEILEEAAAMPGETAKRLERGRDFLDAVERSGGAFPEGWLPGPRRRGRPPLPGEGVPEARSTSDPEGAGDPGTAGAKPAPVPASIPEGLPRIIGALAAYGAAAASRWIARALQRLEKQGDQAVQCARADLGPGSLHPRDLKIDLARRIVTDFHGQEAADAAEAEFRQVFSQRETPSEVEEFVRPVVSEGLWLPGLIVELGLARSNGEAMRLMGQGGVTVDGQKVESKEYRLKSDRPAAYLIKVGKRRFVRIRFE